MGLQFLSRGDMIVPLMDGGGKATWNLEDLVDFEVAVASSPVIEAGVARRIREGLRSGEFSVEGQIRWGLKEWLCSRHRGVGARVVSAARLLSLILLVITFLVGVGLIRGMVTRVDGQAAMNIWVLLVGTIGMQWLILLGGIVAYLLFRYWIGGLGFLREVVGEALRCLAGKVAPQAWRTLLTGRGKQPSALGWRLTRILQVAGVGFNLGLLAGLFGVLWFNEVVFYWESSLSQFGGEILGRLTRGMAWVWGGTGLSAEQIAGLRDLPGETGDDDWRAFMNFIFAALVVWGLVPRLLLWGGAVWKERCSLAGLEFQDPGHRKVWREISRVERSVSMEGMKDGVVMLEVGGLSLPVEAIRPFLLRKLRVNPEKTYGVGVLDAQEEREAWEAIQKAPRGVVMLVEGWNLSPKEMKSLWERIRLEAGREIALRVLVVGDGATAPDEEEFARWQVFIDGLRDARLECVAFEE